MQNDHNTIFLNWLDLHKGLIYKVARAFTRSTDDREDLFQEILLQLWISVPRFRQEAKDATWIYRVAFNTAVVWNRKDKKHKKLKSVTWIEPPANPGADENTEQIENLYRAIRQLEPLDASLVLMSLEGLSYDQMADVLGITQNHVGVKLNRAKKVLAEKMKGLSDEF